MTSCALDRASRTGGAQTPRRRLVTKLDAYADTLGNWLKADRGRNKHERRTKRKCGKTCARWAKSAGTAGFARLHGLGRLNRAEIANEYLADFNREALGIDVDF